MARSPKTTGARRLGVVFAVMLLVLSLSAVAWGAVREVGDTADFTSTPCKDTNCRIVTRVTAFQLKTGTRKNASRIPRDGSVIAFTLNLPTVAKKYISNFDANYSGEASARLSILRAAPRKGATKYRYKLVGQSDPVKLRPYFGSVPSFALDRPIAVKRNDMIAITTDSWMPAFSVLARDAGSTWRASRPNGKCGVTAGDFSNFQTARMHERVGQIKLYECGYKGARLLYRATIVDTPTKTRGYK
jgi:hypothetical protein